MVVVAFVVLAAHDRLVFMPLAVDVLKTNFGRHGRVLRFVCPRRGIVGRSKQTPAASDAGGQNLSGPIPDEVPDWFNAPDQAARRFKPPSVDLRRDVSARV